MSQLIAPPGGASLTRLNRISAGPNQQLLITSYILRPSMYMVKKQSRPCLPNSSCRRTKVTAIQMVILEINWTNRFKRWARCGVSFRIRGAHLNRPGSGKEFRWSNESKLWAEGNSWTSQQWKLYLNLTMRMDRCTNLMLLSSASEKVKVERSGFSATLLAGICGENYDRSTCPIRTIRDWKKMEIDNILRLTVWIPD